MAVRLTREQLIEFEEEVARLFNSGQIRAPVHLDSGNELPLMHYFTEYVGNGDWVLGHWRMHYKCLLHGVEPARLLKDIRAGRSIALCYPDHRVLSTAIAGGALPIALGLAAEGARVHCFLGDMTARMGLFHECVEYARRHALVVNWIIENNGRSVCTPTGHALPGEDPWLDDPRVYQFRYESKWPHAGAGVRVEF